MVQPALGRCEVSATNRWWRDRDAECALWLAARGETDRRWWERVNDDEIVIPLPPLPPTAG